MKKCVKCKVTKNRTDFVIRKAAKDGLYSYCKDCNNYCSKIYYSKNKEEVKAKTRITSIKTNFGVSKELYDKRMEIGKCSICDKTTDLNYDHVHSKEQTFRGVLCGACNRGIGMLGDDLKGVLKAANYLLKFKRRQNDSKDIY